MTPLISPRVPFGLASLEIEAKLLRTSKPQVIGSRSYASVSRAGNAYQLSSASGSKFSQLLTTGLPPFKGGVRLKRAKLAGKKDADCRVFGTGDVVVDILADNFDAPPGWTDKGTRKPDEVSDADATKSDR